MSIGNITLTETRKQAFLLAPPPSKPRKRKALKDCCLSFIDETPDGYGDSILVRKEPRTSKDIYFILRTRKTSVLSRRRNSTHVSVPLYRTKAGGSTRANIEYMNCSFLELDGSTDGTIKTKEDVQALIEKNNLPTASDTIQTSPGHFHVSWTYNNPLPWTTKGESYWLSVQKRYIKLFQKTGFNVDKGASMNPTQNLRNPSQLHPYNYKRRCEVHIYKSYQKTSLRRIYEALNRTTIANPRPIPASTKLRRYMRANKTFEITLAELAITLGTCTKTAQREVSRAIANGDLRIVARVGNNKGIKRATEYTSNLYIEPNSQKGHLSICKNNAVRETSLLEKFKHAGAKKGRRNRTIFALGLNLKAKLGKRACIEAIRGELLRGARACHVREKEFERTLQNVMKPIYDHPFSLAKMREWDLIVEPKHFH